MRHHVPAVTSAASQALGLLQVVVLFWHKGASDETDLYFLLVTWTQVPYQLSLAGIIYPIWTRGRGGNASAVRIGAFAALPASFLFAMVGCLMWTAAGRGSGSSFLLAALFGAQGVVAAFYWIGAYWVAALGDALFISGATLAPNALSVIAGLIAALTTDGARAPSMVIAQMVGILQLPLYLVAMVLSGFNFNDGHPLHPDSESAGKPARWFAGQSLAGYGSLLALQSFAISLSANGLSQLGTVQRIQTGLSGILVNATLPRLVHSDSSSTVSTAIPISLSILNDTSRWASLFRADADCPALRVDGPRRCGHVRSCVTQRHVQTRCCKISFATMESLDNHRQHHRCCHDCSGRPGPDALHPTHRLQCA